MWSRFNATSSSAHAALSPWEGKNALDAAVLGYNNISALRQQLRPTHRIHGIFEGRDWAVNSTRFPAADFLFLMLILIRQLFRIMQNICESSSLHLYGLC